MLRVVDVRLVGRIVMMPEEASEKAANRAADFRSGRTAECVSCTEAYRAADCAPVSVGTAWAAERVPAVRA